MPQRAKVSRSCFLRYGISSVRPRHSACGLPSRKPASNKPGHGLGGHRPVGDAALGGFDLHQRLQPEHAARAVAHDGYVQAPSGYLFAYRAGDRVRSHRERRHVARDENLHARDPPRFGHRQSGSRPPAARPGRRVCRRASPPAKARNCPGNRPHPGVKLPSAVVSPSLAPRRFSTCSITWSQPMDWQASARHIFRTWRPGGCMPEIVVETDDPVHFGLRNIQRVRQIRGTAASST